MRQPILWTPPVMQALRDAMDPLRASNPEADLIRLSRELLDADLNASEPSGAFVPFETDHERDEFWQRWRAALGDEVASMYEESVVQAAIDDILRNEVPSPADWHITESQKKPRFDVRLLLFLNPNYLSTDDVGISLGTEYGYSLGNACTVYSRYNPSAPACFSSNTDRFCSMFTLKDIARFTRLLQNKQLGDVAYAPVSMEESLEMAAEAAGWQEMADAFAQVRSDRAEGRTSTPERSLSWIMADALGYFNTLPTKDDEARSPSIRASRLDNGLKELWKVIAQIFTFFTEHKNIPKVEATALVLSFINHYARIVGCAPYPSMYEFIL